MSSIQKRPNGKWRARYHDPTGKERSKHFERKADAQRFLDEMTTSIVSGQYVDPKAGRITVKEYAEDWRKRQVHRPSTQDYHETMLRRHVYPSLGDKGLSSVMPSDIQAWVKRISNDLQPSTVGVLHGILSGILRAAVADRRIPSNPCEGTRLPKAEKKLVEPNKTSEIHALEQAMPDRFRALVTLAAGTGMRQGECFGLTVDRIDFLRRTVRVDRQLVIPKGAEPTFGPPKTRASVRTIPLPQTVVDALAAHLAQFPASPTGLVFTTEDGKPIRRTMFSARVWRPAVKASGVRQGTRFHDLRHYYASLLIRHNESVKVVQARLRHASAAETLDTYAHLWPDSDDRTREAIDSVFGAPTDSLRTAGASDA